MITFDDARAIALAKVEPTWRNGTCYADTNGLEDSSSFVVRIDAEEWIIDEDVRYMTLDAPLVEIDKKTRAVKVGTYLDDPARYDRMTKISSP